MRTPTNLELAAVAGWGLLLLAIQLGTLDRSLDFVDEAYWLEMTDDPEATRNAGEIFLFQFVLHPIFALVGQDIWAFRLVGFSALLGTAAGMTWSVVAALVTAGLRVPTWASVVVYATVLPSTTLAFGMAVRSLGYRTVVLIGLMVAVAGVTTAMRGRLLTGGFLVGAGVVLTFTGKPTSAVGASLLFAVVLITGKAFAPRVLGGIGVGAVGAVGAVLVVSGMTPQSLVGYMQRGYGQHVASGSHSSVSTMVGLNRPIVTALLVFGPVLLLPLVMKGLHRRFPFDGVMPAASVILAVSVTVVVGLAAVRSLAPRSFGAQILPVAWVPFLLSVGLAAMSLLSSRENPVKHRPTWALFGMLLALPYVAALGSNTRFEYNMAQAGVFWVLAMCVALVVNAEQQSAAWTYLVPSAFTVLSCISVIQWVSLANGGSEDSVLSARSRTQVLGGALSLNADDALALNNLRDVRRLYELDGAPSIDLTGFATGYQLELGTRPLGRASFFGAFDGASRGAAYALTLESCSDRAAAWLLYAEDNPMDVSSAHTQGVLDLLADYTVVHSFYPTQGPSEWRGIEIRLLRPGAAVPAKLGCDAGQQSAATPDVTTP